MFIPFASWESPHWRSDLLKYPSAQSGRFLLQTTRVQFIERRQTLPSHFRWLFFRDRHSLDDANFVVTSPCSPPFVAQELGVAHVPDVLPKELANTFAWSRNAGLIARIFFLDTEEQLRQYDSHARYLVTVGANGWGQWTLLDTPALEAPQILKRTAFYWPSPSSIQEFLAIPTLEIWQRIEQLKSAPNSDCAFARRALELSDERMNALVYRWQKGSLAELDQVLKAALHSNGNLCERWSDYHWNINLDQLGQSRHRGQFAHTNLSHNTITPQAPDELHAILQRVAPYFEPTFDEELISRHLEAARWARNSEHLLTIHVETPTAHEHLEATLLWQEWQKNHPPID